MSSQHFTCTVTHSTEEVAKVLMDLQHWLERLPSAEALDRVNLLLGGNFDYLPRIDLSIQTNASILVAFDAGSSVPLALFEAVVGKMESFPNTEFKARLFDSSSGGIAVWGSAIEEIDFFGKKVLFVGEMDEVLEEMQELAADLGQVQENLAEDTDILVVGHGVDPNLLQKAKGQGVLILTEDEFWEQIADAP